jgi:hypothetical protein
LRYCDATCQHDHWRRGHKQVCKKIHRGGNAEQYHADKKYKEAVAVAVEACAGPERRWIAFWMASRSKLRCTFCVVLGRL